MASGQSRPELLKEKDKPGVSGGPSIASYNIHGRKTCHNEKRKSFNYSILVRLSYKSPKLVCDHVLNQIMGK